jgi:RNA polymerase sigma-70 factor (ECF subfamily)
MITCEPVSESVIIERIVNGDVAAFEILIRRYNPYLYKIGRLYNFGHHDVEDLMQETFINAYMNLRKLQNRFHFKTWLIRIMLNECYRKKQKISGNEIIVSTDTAHNLYNMLADNNDSGKKLGNKELNTIIEKAIHAIPETYRMVFCLREINGLNIIETAKALDITETNVKVRLNRAKAMLRKEVEKMYSPEEVFEFNLVYCDAVVNKVIARINYKNMLNVEC